MEGGTNKRWSRKVETRDKGFLEDGATLDCTGLKKRKASGDRGGKRKNYVGLGKSGEGFSTRGRCKTTEITGE